MTVSSQLQVTSLDRKEVPSDKPIFLSVFNSTTRKTSIVVGVFWKDEKEQIHSAQLEIDGADLIKAAQNALNT